MTIYAYAFLAHTNSVRSKAQFVKCDVRNWDDQVSVFEAAVQNSPHKSCDIVIANAGIVGADNLYDLQGKTTLTFCVLLSLQSRYRNQLTREKILLSLL